MKLKYFTAERQQITWPKLKKTDGLCEFTQFLEGEGELFIFLWVLKQLEAVFHHICYKLHTGEVGDLRGDTVPLC